MDLLLARDISSRRHKIKGEHLMDVYFDVLISYLFGELSGGWGHLSGAEAFQIPQRSAIVEDWFNNLSL